MAGLTRDEEYWQRRNEELEAEWFKRSQKEIEKELAAYYAQALRHIEKDINDLYTRFSIDNSMNMVAVQRLLQGDEFRTWRMDMKEYLDRIEKTGDKKLLRELNTLAMRSRISRLDKLRAETYVEFSKLAEKFGRSMDKFLPSAYKDFYYRNLFEIGRTRGLDTTPVKVDSKEIERVLRTPWSGKNYSERIWGNQERLSNIICNEITSAMHRGCSVEKVSQIVTQKMNVGISDARRLVRTELNYVQNKAALDSIAESGMKYYRFIATLDKRTSTVCREHDGKIYPVEDGSPGTNMPPLHPHCRSTIAGSLKKDSTPKGQRVAREDDGRTYRVPADMNYADWKSVYIDKKMSLDEWRNSKLVSLADDEQYYSKVVRGEISNLVAKNKTYRVNKLEGTQFEIYASVNAKVKPKELHDIQKTLKEAIALINPPKDYTVPKICILTIDEAMAVARYSSFHNRLTIAQGEFLHSVSNKDFVAPNDYRATAVHELLHWLDAMEYIDKHGAITSQAEYRQYLVNRHKKQLEKLGINEYNVSKISEYAKESYRYGKFDEVYTEYRVLKLLKGC